MISTKLDIKIPAAGRRIATTIVLSLALLSCAGQPVSEKNPVPEAGNLTIEGKSFHGHIRAKGILGMVSVKGTLSFENGRLVWTARDQRDSAPYTVEELNGTVKFTAHVPLTGDTYVDWNGTYDGVSVSQVHVIWNRSEEQDFIHDLFLPDVVKLVFRQDKN